MNKHLKNYRTESFNGNKPPGIRSLTNESGSALVVALIILVALITLVPVVMKQSTGEMYRAANFKENRQVFYIAEAGLEHGLSALKANDLQTILNGPDGDNTATTDNGTVAGVGTPVTWNGNLYNEVNFSNGTYKFRLYDNNDEDGDLTTDVDRIVFVEGIGVNAEGNVKTVRTLVRKIALPPLPGAVVVTSTIPGLELKLSSTSGYSVEGEAASGNGFAIDGTEDTDCPGTPGVSTAEASVGVGELDVTCFDDACVELEGSSVEDDISGTASGGTPNVATGITSFTQQDLWDLHAKLTAGLTMVSGTTTITTTENWGTAATPLIRYYENLTIAPGADITGYGILIVDSELRAESSGTMTWYGLILSGACPSVACTNDSLKLKNTTIYGSVLVGGDEVGMGDSGGIRYSCEGLNFAGLAMGETLNTLAWNEVD